MTSSLTLATISSMTSARTPPTTRSRPSVRHPTLRMPVIVDRPPRAVDSRALRRVRDVPERERFGVEHDLVLRAEVAQEGLRRGLGLLERDLAPHALATPRLRRPRVVDRLEQQE